MTAHARGRRSPRRVLLEVAALGVVALLAVVWAKGRDDAPSEETDTAEAVQDLEVVETPTPASMAISSDPETWKTMSHDNLGAVGRLVAGITPGFRFDRVEVVSGAGLANAVAVLVHERTELEFSLIPPGSFRMGSPESEAGRSECEGPRHRVTLERAFLLCRTECTVRAWLRVEGPERPTLGPPPWADLPAADFSWNEANTWCRRVGLRLPSEAEWEYACRAGTTTRYWSGDDESDLARVAWFSENSGGRKRVAREKPPNPFGLFGMHGGVSEWCEDAWHESYRGAPSNGDAWVRSGSTSYVTRGGTFDSAAMHNRSASRSWSHPRPEYDTTGFRPAATVGTE